MSINGMGLDHPQQNAAAPHRYLALDGLRGVAAFAVLFYHLRNIEAADRPAQAASLFASGYLAVDLFFVLSGFVIAHAYGTRLGSTLGLRQFMVARFVRLQPVIAIGTLLGFVIALASRTMGLPGSPGLFAISSSLVPNLLMLPNPLVPWGIFLFNPPAWSLFYELVANALYAVGACSRRPAGSRVTGGDPALWAMAVLGLSGLVTSVWFGGNLDRGVVLADWPVALARIAFSFSAGLLLHHTRERWMPAVPRLPIGYLLGIGLCLLAPDLTGVYRAAYDLVFATVLSPLLVMLTAVVVLSPKWARVTTWLGMISYPLYAVHAPIKHMWEAFVPVGFPPLLFLTSVTAVLAAWVTGAIVDPALRGWLTTYMQASKLLRPATATQGGA